MIKSALNSAYASVFGPFSSTTNAQQSTGSQSGYPVKQDANKTSSSWTSFLKNPLFASISLRSFWNYCRSDSGNDTKMAPCVQTSTPENSVATNSAFRSEESVDP